MYKLNNTFPNNIEVENKSQGKYKIYRELLVWRHLMGYLDCRYSWKELGEDPENQLKSTEKR